MIEEQPVGSSGEPVDQVIGLLSTAVEALTAAGADRGWACSNDTLRERVRLADRAMAVAEGLRLATVRALQARPEAVPGADGGKAGATFLIHGCRVSPWQAARDVAAAQASDPDDGTLPLLGAALAAGEVSRAHLDVAVAAVARIPAPIKKLVLCDGAPRWNASTSSCSATAAPSHPPPSGSCATNWSTCSTPTAVRTSPPTR
jgi:hypothetical protein